MGRLGLGLVLCTGLMVAWIVIPFINYGSGTAVDITVKVIKSPFVESPVLVYEWTGTVTRLCAVEIRRKMISSDGVVTSLLPLNLNAPPRSALGKQSYEIRISVPELIAEGPAIYQATEISRCNWLERMFPAELHYPPVQFTISR